MTCAVCASGTFARDTSGAPYPRLDAGRTGHGRVAAFGSPAGVVSPGGGAGVGAGAVACPALEVAGAVEEFGAALVDRAGEGGVVGAGVARRGEGDARQVVFVGLAQPHRLVVVRGRPAGEEVRTPCPKPGGGPRVLRGALDAALLWPKDA